MLVLSTLGAPKRTRVSRGARKRKAQPEPDPARVPTSRVTIIDVSEPFEDSKHAAAWLGEAGEEELAADIAIINRALHAFRLVTADPYLNAVSREQALVTRVGFGAGEEVAEGLWTDARELHGPRPRQGRVKVLQPQARLAAVLNGRERALTCEELALRARLDLDQGRDREAALQAMIALDAALAELPGDPTGPVLSERVQELKGRREAIARAAQAALARRLDEGEREAVEFTLGRLEAALRARAVENA